MKFFSKKSIIILFVVFLVGHIAADQVSKQYARDHIQGNGRIEIVGNFFAFEFTYNPGSFLGLGRNIPEPAKTIVLGYLPLILIAVMFAYFLPRSKPTILNAFALSGIIGGGLGNLYDRIFMGGKVTDFMHIYVTDFLQSGIFNIADLSILFGAIIILIVSMIDEAEAEKLAKQGKTTDSASK